MKSKNIYYAPVKLTKYVIITYKMSPAHVGNLKHGVDFIVPEGTEIFASLDGVVSAVKQDSNVGGKYKKYDKYGNYIEIEHKHGEHSIYEHIRKNGSLVKEGDKVKAGQKIGYSGNTGWMAHEGPHLHFDVHVYFGKGDNDYRTRRIRWKLADKLKMILI